MLEFVTGPKGWQRLVKFGIDTDYVCVIQPFIRVMEPSGHEVSLSLKESTETLTIVKALFEECRLFCPEPNNTYTWHLLSGMNKYPEIWFDGRVGSLSWPTTEAALQRPMEYARQLAELTQQLFDANWTNEKTRAMWYCMDNSAYQLPYAVRVKVFKELAEKEEVEDVDLAVKHFTSVIPLADKLYSENQDNRKSWISIGEKFRKQQQSREFDPTKKGMLKVILSNVGLMDISTENERLFSKICMLESKNRERKLKLWNLFDALVVAARFPLQISSYANAVPDGLTKERSAITYKIDACDMIKRAQVQYVEFHPAMRTPLAKQYGVKAARVQATAGVGRLPKMNGKVQKSNDTRKDIIS